MNVALDKFFCKVPETKATDKQIEFHSEREANELLAKIARIQT